MAFVSAWAVPGLAHILIGRRVQGFVFLVSIMALFVSGAVMSDFKGVSREFHPLTFYAQICCGGPTLLHLLLFGKPSADDFKGSIPPLYDAGTLYMMIAGLLNIVVIADALERTMKKQKRGLGLEECGESGAKKGTGGEKSGTCD
ncbi:MAG: hypothetical protein N2234_10075 [Planctomycetota bacterium]|nr:hypothetical protein [Planctomycetota bacterium]